jgi:uncharacterized protein (DUF58 family)
VHLLVRAARTLEPMAPVFEGAPALAAREEESSYELLLPTVQALSPQRAVVVLLADLSRPSVLEGLAASLPRLCRRHLTVVLSVQDRAYSLEERVLATDASTLDLPGYGSLLYAYWLDERLRLFRARLASEGAGVLVATEREWIGLIARLYGLLRESLRA